MMIDGQWLIHYNKETTTQQEILEATLAYAEKRETKRVKEIHYLDFSSSTQSPRYRQVQVQDLLAESPLSIYEGAEIKKVGLFNPVQLNDKRWQTIHLTSAALFLGSALRAKDFHVVTGKLVLPALQPEPTLLDCDTLGFTLFEDLFLPMQTFLKELRQTFQYKSLLAAGGPLVTQNALETAYFMPELNLLVRGEAELILAHLYNGIQQNKLNQLFSFNGYMLQWPGWLLISNLDQINRPISWESFSFNLSFLEKRHFSEGLEINLSRGCGRSCVFCSAVQGKTLRKLPAKDFDDLLTGFSQQLEEQEIESPRARTLNINDDDILQDAVYAQSIFKILQSHQFRLWGIQTSIHSLLDTHQKIRYEMLDLIAQPALFMNDSPLVWLGTDAFLKERGKKLGKAIPDRELLFKLLEALDEHDINHYHYWISSDHHSTWSQFFAEFHLIYQCVKEFPYFGLIAHAPFLVPYPATPLYRWLLQTHETTQQIKYKKNLYSTQKKISLTLVERVETPFPYLNRLLNNETLGQEYGFFDYLQQKDYWNCFITLYSFLKQERLEAEVSRRIDLVPELKQTQEAVEEFLSQEI